MGSEWFYLHDGAERGPVSSAQIKNLAASGELLPTDFVWLRSMKDPVPASFLKVKFGPAPDDESVRDGMAASTDRSHNDNLSKGGVQKIRKRRTWVVTGAVAGVLLMLWALSLYRHHSRSGTSQMAHSSNAHPTPRTSNDLAEYRALGAADAHSGNQNNVDVHSDKQANEMDIASRAVTPSKSFVDATKAIVVHDLEPTSEEYTAAGFKEFVFGMKRAEVENVAGALTESRTIPAWLQDHALNQYRFDEAGGLRGIVRRYVGNNRGYLAVLRQVFGGAREGDTSTAYQVDPSQNHSIAITQATYIFPKTYVAIQSADDRIGYSQSDRLFLSIYDRQWLGVLLEQEARNVEDLLHWINEDPVLNSTSPNLKEIVGPAGLSRQYPALQENNPANIWWRWNGVDADSVSFSSEQDRLLVGQKAIRRGANSPSRGNLRILISTAAIARGGVPMLATLDRGTNSIIAQVNRDAVQNVLTPIDNQIRCYKTTSNLERRYEWETKSGWHVNVDLGSIVIVHSAKLNL